MIPGMESGAEAERQPGARRARFRREESELEFARIVAFSDGVFAIAMTLLVLALHIPEGVADLHEELTDQLPDFLAFALSFAVLARLWFFHHRFFGSLSHFDGPLIGINFLYLGLIALVPFTSELIGDYGEDRLAAIVYAANLAGVGIAGAVMVRYAFGRQLVRTEMADALGIRGGPGSWYLGVAFLVSIPVAAISAHAAEVCWVVALVGGGALLRWSVRQASSR
jgi:uncharacterized membrane protein